MGFKMTDILPPAGWLNVRQLETNEFATGGANGNMNEQAKSLAARSELLKQYAALPYESKTGGYALNERAQLATGDIVRSTIPSNVNNPNENMTGWVKTNDASQIISADGSTQQEINDFGGAKWRNKPLGYDIGSTVKLENGDIVKSTIDGNENNPNVNMTGWFNPEKEAELHNKSFVTITDITKDKNITTALSSLGTLGIKKIKIPSGDWEIDSALVISNDIEFDFDLDANIVIKNGGSLKFTGSSTKIASYSISVSNSSYLLDGIDASGLQGGDLICLYDPTDFSFCNARASYRKGEFLEVRKVIDSTSIQLSSRPLFDYDSFDLYKINPIKVKFNRLNIKNEAGVGIPVMIDFGRDINVDEYSNDTAINSAFTIQRSFNINVKPIKTKNISSASGDNYGLTISNCQQFNISGGFYQGTRHGIALGGIDGICAIPTQQGSISNATIKYDGTTNVMAADMHGNVNFIKYINCTLDGSKMGGSNAKLVGCEISGRLSDNLAILGAEIRGGYFDIIDCKLLVNGAPSSDFGYIYFALSHKLKENLNIKIKDIEIISSNATLDTSTPCVFVQSSVAQDFETNIFMGNISSNAKALRLLLRCVGVDTVNGVANTLKMGRCKIGGFIDIIKDGVGIYVLPTATFTNEGLVDLSLPAQTGYVDQALNGEASGIVITPTTNFKYKYPRPPRVLATISPPAGVVNNSAWLANLQNITAGNYENHADRVKFTLRSEKTMPSATTVRVNWQAML